MLPLINGEFGVVGDPEIRFSEKGSAWIKIRGIAKDRMRDAQGQWKDGDPLFIDIVSGNSAEHLFESVVKGDTIIVSGKLKQREYEKDGEKRVVLEIRADSIGVSTRWNPAKTPNAAGSSTNAAVDAAQATLGAQVISETPPF